MLTNSDNDYDGVIYSIALIYNQWLYSIIIRSITPKFERASVIYIYWKKTESSVKRSCQHKEMIINKGGRNVTRNGRTKPNSATGTLEISINKSYAEIHSPLEVARTILHEYIHADIFRKLSEDTDADFISVYRNFQDKKFRATAQHETMAKLYINSMRNALKDFHKNVLTKSYNELTEHFSAEPTDEFYEALSWIGLRDRGVKEYQDLTTEKKKSIDSELQKLGLLSKTNNPCNN